MAAAKHDHLFKILVIGDPGVGKSSLLLRFTDATFSESLPSSLGEDFKSRVVDIDGKKVSLEVWDTQGQERFRTITSSYYRGAHGILLVYDVTEQTSFEKIPQWISEVDRYACDANNRILVGNKIDLANEGKRVVERSSAEKTAKDLKLEFFETSAKSGENVSEVFTRIGALCLKKVQSLEPKQNDSIPMGTVELKDGGAGTTKKKEKSSGCVLL